MAVYFNGTEKERQALLAALEHNCDCNPAQKCAPHKMLLEDQRAIDGLIFERRQAGRLLKEEGMEP